MTIVAWNRTEYDRSRYFRVKDDLIACLGGKCVQCGSSELLEFDHIIPATKSFAIMKRWNRGLDVLLPELEKCQLLCTTCHSAKTIEVVSVEHGGGESGKRNCSCPDCRARKNSYMRAWRAAHAQRNSTSKRMVA
jgi:hypothetical protein